MWNIVSQWCIYYANENYHWGYYHKSCKMLMKQMYDVLPTNLWRDVLLWKKLTDSNWYFIWSTYKRIRLSLEDRLVQAKEMYLIPWMILETEIVFLVKSTPTTISMDHRSFGHHWTAKVYTYKYQHGPDHLGITEQPESTPTNISMDHRSFGHHWTAKVYTYKYQHGPQIIWAPLNSQSLHLQMKFNVLLVRHTSDYIYQSCKHICLYDHHS